MKYPAIFSVSLAFLKAKVRSLKSSHSVGYFCNSPRDIFRPDGKLMNK